MLTILIGVTGSGKSTFTEYLLGEVCEADSYPDLYQNGVIRHQLLSIAHETCIKQVEEYMKQGVPVIQSNTNLDVRSIHPYLIIAQKYNYPVSLRLPEFDLLYFRHSLTREEQINHIIQVRSHGPKLVPIHVIQRMIETFDRFRPRIMSLQHITDPSTLLRLL